MDYIVYRCNKCKKHFILLNGEVEHSEQESKYITCLYNGKHSDIKVIDCYEGVKECIKHDSYIKVKGRMVQKGWSNV